MTLSTVVTVVSFAMDDKHLQCVDSETASAGAELISTCIENEVN